MDPSSSDSVYIFLFPFQDSTRSGFQGTATGKRKAGGRRQRKGDISTSDRPAPFDAGGPVRYKKNPTYGSTVRVAGAVVTISLGEWLTYGTRVRVETFDGFVTDKAGNIFNAATNTAEKPQSIPPSQR